MLYDNILVLCLYYFNCHELITLNIVCYYTGDILIAHMNLCKLFSLLSYYVS